MDINRLEFSTTEIVRQEKKNWNKNRQWRSLRLKIEDFDEAAGDSKEGQFNEKVHDTLTSIEMILIIFLGTACLFRKGNGIFVTLTIPERANTDVVCFYIWSKWA